MKGEKEKGFTDREVHAVVITGLQDGQVSYNDPWFGQAYSMATNQFGEAWRFWDTETQAYWVEAVVFAPSTIPVAATQAHPLIGKWQELGGANESMEFLSDGKLIARRGSDSATFTYTILDGDRIQVFGYPNYQDRPLISPFKITGDRLVITSPSTGAYEYQRVSDNQSPPQVALPGPQATIAAQQTTIAQLQSTIAAPTNTRAPLPSLALKPQDLYKALLATPFLDQELPRGLAFSGNSPGGDPGPTAKAFNAIGQVMTFITPIAKSDQAFGSGLIVYTIFPTAADAQGSFNTFRTQPGTSAYASPYPPYPAVSTRLFADSPPILVVLVDNVLVTATAPPRGNVETDLVARAAVAHLRVVQGIAP